MINTEILGRTRDSKAFDLEASGQADLVEGGQLEITDIKSCLNPLDRSHGGSIATMIADPSRVCSLLLCDLSEEEETSRRTVKSRTNGRVVTVSFTHANTLQVGLSTFGMRNQD